jgi:hypothetical protein
LRNIEPNNAILGILMMKIATLEIGQLLGRRKDGYLRSALAAGIFVFTTDAALAMAA